MHLCDCDPKFFLIFRLFWVGKSEKRRIFTRPSWFYKKNYENEMLSLITTLCRPTRVVGGSKVNFPPPKTRKIDFRVHETPGLKTPDGVDVGGARAAVKEDIVDRILNNSFSPLFSCFQILYSTWSSEMSITLIGQIFIPKKASCIFFIPTCLPLKWWDTLLWIHNFIQFSYCALGIFRWQRIILIKKKVWFTLCLIIIQCLWFFYIQILFRFFWDTLYMLLSAT